MASEPLLDGAATKEVFEEVFDDDAPPKEGASIQRIRANSSIMKLRKILVANRGEIRELRLALRGNWVTIDVNGLLTAL